MKGDCSVAVDKAPSMVVSGIRGQCAPGGIAVLEFQTSEIGNWLDVVLGYVGQYNTLGYECMDQSFPVWYALYLQLAELDEKEEETFTINEHDDSRSWQFYKVGDKLTLNVYATDEDPSGLIVSVTFDFMRFVFALETAIFAIGRPIYTQRDEFYSIAHAVDGQRAILDMDDFQEWIREAEKLAQKDREELNNE